MVEQFKFKEPEKHNNLKKQKVEVSISENGDVKSDSPFMDLIIGNDEDVVEEEKSQSGSVELPLIITRAMEKQLLNKGLTQAEINKLTPESAHFLLENNFPEPENSASKDQNAETEKIKVEQKSIVELLNNKQEELDSRFKAGANEEELAKLEEERDELRKQVALSKEKENPDDSEKKSVFEAKLPAGLIITQENAGNQDKSPKTQKENLEAGSDNNPPSGNNPEILGGGPGNKPPRNKSEIAEHYGFKDTSLKNNLAKGALDTIGTVFGVRLAWELPKLVSDSLKKKGAKDATLELLDAVKERNQIVNIAKEKYPDNKNFKIETAEGEKESLPVREKIAAFNEKLKNVKLPESEKKELRDQMAKVLWEHRHSTEEIDKNRADKVGKVFDVYANDSVQRMTVAREAVNTASIFLMMPWLRGVGYTALAGAGSVAKVSNEFDKKHFNEEKINSKEKLSYIAKAMTIDSAKETYNSIIGNFINKNEKGEKMSFGKALAGSISKAFSLGFGAARLAGVFEFEHALQSGNLIMTEGGAKMMDALKSGSIGEALKQGGQNWVNNTERILLSVSHISENLSKLVSGFVNRFKSGNTHAEMEKIKELATIHKGEGVINTFQRQIEHNPKDFGFKGDIHNQIALHKFASQKAYSIALEDKYIKSDGSEVRISYDAKNPEQFILNPKNHQVQELNTRGHEYSFNPEKSNLAEINRTLEVKTHIENIYKSDSILPSQPEEWERVKHLKANDFIAGHFGTPVGDLDMVEAQDRIQLQDYLKELKNKSHIVPGSNESTEAFILRANNIHSLNAESLPGFKEFKEHHDKLQGIKQRIGDIYKWQFGPFGGSQIEEWKTVSGLKAADFIAGKNIPTIGNQLDAVELGDRQKMQDYLKELLSKSHLTIKNNETVDALIARANKLNLKDLKDIFKAKA
jgi:hypothetical protein